MRHWLTFFPCFVCISFHTLAVSKITSNVLWLPGVLQYLSRQPQPLSVVLHRFLHHPALGQLSSGRMLMNISCSRKFCNCCNPPFSFCRDRTAQRVQRGNEVTKGIYRLFLLAFIKLQGGWMAAEKSFTGCRLLMNLCEMSSCQTAKQSMNPSPGICNRVTRIHKQSQKTTPPYS